MKLKSLLWAVLAFCSVAADPDYLPGEWKDWKQIDSGITPNLKFHPQTKIAAKWSNNYTHIDLFGTDPAGTVYAATFDYDSVGYRGWWPIHPDVKAAVGSSVTALWRGNDHLNIFITAADGVVWQSTWDRGGNGWADWSPIRTESRFAPGAPVTAIARDDGHMDLFISDSDGAIWSTWWDAAEGTGWHPWFGVDNSYKMGKVVAVTAMWNGTSRIDLAVVDGFGYLMTTTFDYSKGWQADIPTISTD